jgi:PilZ domain
MEHRWGVRVPLSMPVEVRLPDAPVADGWMHDASISGCCLELVQTRCSKLHMPVEVRLPCAPGDAERPCLRGRLVRQVGTRWGIEWDELAPEGLGFWLARRAA